MGIDHWVHAWDTLVYVPASTRRGGEAPRGCGPTSRGRCRLSVKTRSSKCACGAVCDLESQRVDQPHQSQPHTKTFSSLTHRSASSQPRPPESSAPAAPTPPHPPAAAATGGCCCCFSHRVLMGAWGWMLSRQRRGAGRCCWLKTPWRQTVRGLLKSKGRGAESSIDRMYGCIYICSSVVQLR